MKEENKSCLSTIIYIVGIICAFIDFMFLLAMVYEHPIMQIPTALGIGSLIYYWTQRWSHKQKASAVKTGKFKIAHGDWTLKHVVTK